MPFDPAVPMVNNNHDCEGTVDTLRGQRVMFTGKTFYRGEHVQRKDLERDIQLKGGAPQHGTRNQSSTLLILGGLHPDVVTDGKNNRSQTLVFVDAQAARGNHICIVDDAGYELLINDRPAPCIQHRRPTSFIGPSKGAALVTNTHRGSSSVHVFRKLTEMKPQNNVHSSPTG